MLLPELSEQETNKLYHEDFFELFEWIHQRAKVAYDAATAQRVAAQMTVQSDICDCVDI